MDNNERTMVSIIDSYGDETFNVMLNEKEIKFLKWLSANSLLHDEVTFNIIKSCDEDFT
jgi:hypothetical protein